MWALSHFVAQNIDIYNDDRKKIFVVPGQVVFWEDFFQKNDISLFSLNIINKLTELARIWSVK